jgi:hypothetical protein
LKTSRREILDPTVALPKGRIASIRAWRSFAIVALLLSIVSCGDAQHTDVSVDKATLLHDPNGNFALEVFLNERSIREFSLYTIMVYYSEFVS